MVKAKSAAGAGAKRSSLPYARGRMRFLAKIDAIRSDLAAGATMTTVHARYCSNVTYSAFAKLVNRYASDARPSGVSTGKSTQETVTHERSPQRDHSGTADPALIRKLTRGG